LRQRKRIAQSFDAVCACLVIADQSAMPAGPGIERVFVCRLKRMARRAHAKRFYHHKRHVPRAFVDDDLRAALRNHFESMTQEQRSVPYQQMNENDLAHLLLAAKLGAGTEAGDVASSEIHGEFERRELTKAYVLSLIDNLYSLYTCDLVPHEKQ
jgi:hypothetical protein